MPLELATGLIAAGAALLGGGITGFATYRAALIGFRTKRTHVKLRAALEDVEFPTRA